MQKQVDPSIEELFDREGFIRVSDTDVGAKYVRGSDSLIVSGHYVFLSHGGMIRAFPEEKVPILGLQMMERLTRFRPQPYSGQEDKTNYYLPMAKDHMV